MDYIINFNNSYSQFLRKKNHTIKIIKGCSNEISTNDYTLNISTTK